MNFNTISVIGLGYIGLPTAAMFASHGIKVIGVDINQQVVDTINKGEIHIVEPGLYNVVSETVRNGVLRATTTAEPADAFLIAVPTPFEPNELTPDLKYLEAASKLVAPVLKKGDLIILESTSPVGTTESLCQWLTLARPDLTFPQVGGNEPDIYVAYCPERVLPGKTMQELIANDRVIGGMTPSCSDLAADLYRIFVEGDCVIATNPRVAEMAKLTENSFRDVNIAFANELSIICDKIEVDVWELINLSNKHPRVNILEPGPGVGGHCIAVDPWFIVSKSPAESRLIRTAREVNDSKPQWVLEKVNQAIKGLAQQNPTEKSANVKIACYGLTFKPDVDDLRESPALKIASKISALSFESLMIIEPQISELPKNLQARAVLVDYEYAATNADVHVLLVDHEEFRTKQPPKGEIVDTKGIWKS